MNSVKVCVFNLHILINKGITLDFQRRIIELVDGTLSLKPGTGLVVCRCRRPFDRGDMTVGVR